MSVPQQGLLSGVGFTSVFGPTREWSVVQDVDHVTLSPPRLQPYKPEYVGHLKTRVLRFSQLEKPAFLPPLLLYFKHSLLHAHIF